jgi:hypothetical protein
MTLRTKTLHVLEHDFTRIIGIVSLSTCACMEFAGSDKFIVEENRVFGARYGYID